jgi:hypothetical protein
MIRTLRRALALLAVPAAAVALVALPQAAQAAPAHPARHAVVKPDATFGAFYICANGGAGLCLQNSGVTNSFVANDVMAAGGPTKQEWKLVEVGFADHSTYPFATKALNQQVAAGRTVYTIHNTYSNVECLNASTSFETIMEPCTGPNPVTGQLFVATGSGRLVNVAFSNAQGALMFYFSSGTDGGRPGFTSVGTHPCPAFCWGNVDH